MAEKKEKISSSDAGLMLAVAGFFDFVQIVISPLDAIGVGVVANKFISIIAIFTFFLWLSIKGVGVQSKRILFGGGVAELLPIPFLSSLPFFMGVIFAIIKREKNKSLLGAVSPTGSNLMTESRKQK